MLSILKHPTIKKEETFHEITIGNGEHFDIYTVDNSKKENTGYIKVYVSELGKVRIYIDKEDNIEVLVWNGNTQFKKQVSDDFDLYCETEEIDIG